MSILASARVFLAWVSLIMLANLSAGGQSAPATGGGSLGGSSQTSQTDGLTPNAFTFQGVPYPNIVRAPSGYDGSRPLPAILLLHGARGRGQDMITLWQGLADAQQILLVAPTFPPDPDFEKLVPQLFPVLMDAVKQRWKVDPNRIYVFGYSAGGYSAFDAATLDSTYFAAAGVFASIITPDYYWIIQRAKRKTPIAIYIGDHDQFFTVEQVQATRDRLAASGFPIHFVVLAKRDHNYGAASGTVNPDAWKFLSQYSLGR